MLCFDGILSNLKSLWSL